MRQRWQSSLDKALRSDSCGCATGAIFLGVALLITGAWYGWHWQTAMLSPGATAAHIFGLSFAAAIVGKFVGLFLHKTRSRSHK